MVSEGRKSVYRLKEDLFVSAGGQAGGAQRGEDLSQVRDAIPVVANQNRDVMGLREGFSFGQQEEQNWEIQKNRFQGLATKMPWTMAERVTKSMGIVPKTYAL